MPGAADGVAVHQPFGERAAVVRAEGADGEELPSSPDHDHLLAVRMSEKRSTFESGRGRNAFSEVQTGQLRVRFTHGIPREREADYCTLNVPFMFGWKVQV